MIRIFFFVWHCVKKHQEWTVNSSPSLSCYKFPWCVWGARPEICEEAELNLTHFRFMAREFTEPWQQRGFNENVWETQKYIFLNNLFYDFEKAIRKYRKYFKERKKERKKERTKEGTKPKIYILIFFLSMSVLIFECLAICTEKQDKHSEQGFFLLSNIPTSFYYITETSIYIFRYIQKTNWHLYVCYPVISPSKH